MPSYTLFVRNELLYHLDYSAWANQTLLAACSELSPEELERDLGSSHASILQTWRHIYYSERVWLQRLLANKMPPLVEIGDQRLFGDPPPEPKLQQLQMALSSVSANLKRYFENFPDVELSENLIGSDCEIPRWRLVLHIVNHSTLHRGQITGMLRQLGGKPPNTDVFSYHMLRP